MSDRMLKKKNEISYLVVRGEKEKKVGRIVSKRILGGRQTGALLAASD